MSLVTYPTLLRKRSLNVPPLSVTFWKNELISAIAGAYELAVNAGYLVASCVVLFSQCDPFWIAR